MKSTSTVFRRTMLGATALVAASLFSLGAATAAHAETPPDSQPAQTYTDWDPAAGAVWGTGGYGTGIDWVAATFTFEGNDNLGYDSYTRIDGAAPSSSDLSQLGSVMNYGDGCFVSYNSTQVYCHD